VKTAILAILAAAAVVAGCGSGGAKATTTGSAQQPPAAKAPAVYRVRFTTTKGPFVVTVYRAWAPRGADRFYQLVRACYYDGDRLFRVVPGFVVQWGINPSPAVSATWERKTIHDDPVTHSNTPGTIAFATAGPNSRTTQVFVNLGSNSSLDGQGFAPFGRVSSDMTSIAKLYHGYGEQPTRAQAQMFAQGEAFLAKTFPKLDRILTARIVR
jgi:peptidyl-prolyl cis-trans isomerase A (cyclophilin A)